MSGEHASRQVAGVLPVCLHMTHVPFVCLILRHLLAISNAGVPMKKKKGTLTHAEADESMLVHVGVCGGRLSRHELLQRRVSRQARCFWV